MKRKKLEDALDHMKPEHIAEAAAPAKRKKKALPWLGAVAALLALVLAGKWIEIPMAIRAEAISLAEPDVPTRPDRDDYKDADQWRKELEAWSAQGVKREADALEALSGMKAFLRSSTATSRRCAMLFTSAMVQMSSKKR